MELTTSVSTRPQALVPFPEEILETIVTYAGQNTDYTALTNLCLVSRQLHRIAQPHLYSSIRLDIRKPKEHRLTKCAKRITQLWRAPPTSLLSLLTVRSDLSHHVRTLRLIHDPYEHPQWETRYKQINAYLDLYVSPGTSR